MKIRSLDDSVAVEHKVIAGAVVVTFSNSENPVCTLKIDVSDMPRLAMAINKFKTYGAARFELERQALLIEGPEDPTNKRDPLHKKVQIRIIKVGSGEAVVNGIFQASAIDHMLQALESVHALSA